MQQPPGPHAFSSFSRDVPLERAHLGTEGLGPAARDSAAIPTLGDSLKKGRGQCPGESSESLLRTFINEVINR